MKTEKTQQPTRTVGRRRALTASLLTGVVGLGSSARAQEQSPKTRLRMATSWPTSLPLLHESALDFARSVEALTDGRLVIDVDDPGKHGKPVGILDLVRSGDYDLGHTTAQYYAQALPAIDFFTAVPFGLTPIENHAWMLEGRGLELLNQALAPTGVRAQVAGDTGTQMGGWFTKEILTADDLKGLRIRIAGFCGRVLEGLGAKPVGLPLGQIASAFEAKSIDAADIVGPAIDQAVGVAKHARYYYAPWHELNVALHLFMNSKRIDALPPAWKTALHEAASACALRSLARAQYRNAVAMQELLAQGVQLRRFPDSVVHALQAATTLELEKAAGADKRSAAVIDSWRAAKGLLLPYGLQVDAAALQVRNTM